MQLQSVPGEPPDPSEIAANALLARGTVMVSGPLDPATAGTATARLLALDNDHRGERGDRPITLHLTNVTGSVADGLMLHDVVRHLQSPVEIVAGGMLDVAGAIVLVAGPVGHRRLLPNARIHLRRIDEPSTPDLPVEQAAQEVEVLRAQAEAALGLPLDRPMILSADEAIDRKLADRK